MTVRTISNDEIDTQANQLLHEAQRILEKSEYRKEMAKATHLGELSYVACLKIGLKKAQDAVGLLQKINAAKATQVTIIGEISKKIEELEKPPEKPVEVKPELDIEEKVEETYPHVKIPKESTVQRDIELKPKKTKRKRKVR